MEVPWKVLLKKKFKNVHLFIKDIEELLKHVGKDLRPEIQNYTYSSGVQKELFVLDGTIPITFRGVMYNIPLCVFLQEDHPLVPPLVYVRPTNSMVIIPSQHVDTEGRVYHPYLNEWDPVKESSDITSLIQIMCSTFSEVSPVYSKRPPRQNSSNNVTETQPRTRTANPSPRGTILLYSAISNFAGLAPGGRLNLSFVVGDEIEVVNKNDPEWWEGRSKRTGAVGYFPQSHVTAKATSCYEETTIREETHPTPPPATLNASLKNFNWFAGRRDRLQAEQMLSTKSDGTFLIRESVSRGGEYVLSVKVRSNVKHIKIPYEEGAFYLTKAISFGSIEELVDYYKLNTLGVSVPRVDTNLRQGVNEEPKIKDDQTDDYCIVCMELKKDSVFIPCGHLGICFKCASRCKETSKTCPVCRKQITEVHRVYQP